MRAADDTGVERELATFVAGDVPDLRHPAARGALARLRSTAAMRRFGWPRVYAAVTGLVIVAACICIPFGLIGAMKVFRLPPIWLLFTLVPVFAAMIFGIIVVSSMMLGRGLGAGVHLVATALLRMGRCASCGYPIDSIPADGDGILRCPECGAGWRGDRVGREAVPSVKPSLAAFAKSAIVSSAMCRTRQRDDRGRPFQASALQHFGADQTQRALKRVTIGAWPWFVVLILTILAWVAGCITALMVVKTVTTALLVLGILIVGIVAVIGINGRIGRITRRRQLRFRMCLACEQRLRREGDMLVCARCDGAWRRPKRR